MYNLLTYFKQMCLFKGLRFMCNSPSYHAEHSPCSEKHVCFQRLFVRHPLILIHTSYLSHSDHLTGSAIQEQAVFSHYAVKHIGLTILFTLGRYWDSTLSKDCPLFPQRLILTLTTKARQPSGRPVTGTSPLHWR